MLRSGLLLLSRLRAPRGLALAGFGALLTWGALGGPVGAQTAAPASAPAATDPSPALARVEDPIAAAKERLSRVCLNIELSDGFEQRLDLNGDALDDVIITDTVVCDGFHSAFCGVGGCSGEVFVAIPGGGYMRTGLPPNVTIVTDRSRPAVRAGRGARAVVYLWLGDRFIPEREIGQARPAAASAYGAALAERAASALEAGAGWDAPDETSADPTSIAAAAGGADIGRWVALPGRDPGAFRALVRGADGISALALSCRPGDPVLSLTFKPTLNAAQTLPLEDVAEITVSFEPFGAPAVDRRLLHAAASGVWRGKEPARSALVAALAAGSGITVRLPGAVDPLGRFSLEGSARALARLLTGCGL